MIPKELETLIEDSKLRGVWSGYVRQEYSEDLLNDLLDSGNYLKVKSLDPIKSKGGTLWAIVMKGFERSIFF